ERSADQVRQFHRGAAFFRGHLDSSGEVHGPALQGHGEHAKFMPRRRGGAPGLRA
ncbi:unnamed protein product, partial [Prorocentrum cordatum]